MLYQVYSYDKKPLEKHVVLPDNSDWTATELAIASELKALKFIKDSDIWLIADNSEAGEFYRILMPVTQGIHRRVETYLYLQRATLSRRVLLYPDIDYSLADWLDINKDREQWKYLEAMIDRNGVWGYVCEALICGEWEHIDSCWGFIGDDRWSETLRAMREHMPSEFRTIEPLEGKV